MSIQDMEDLKQQYLNEMKSLINSEYRNELKGNFNEMSIEINKKKKLQQIEQVANLSTYPSQHFNSFCYDDDDDEEATIQVREYYKNSPVSITPEFSITNSLIIDDEHLDTIPETKSDELIKSSVENLVPSPSEFEDLSDIESDDDESFSDENISNEVYSNPLFEEEIISTKIDPHHFNDEYGLIESLLNHDTSIISSPKIDSLLEEFSYELSHIDLVPSGINEADFDPEEEIRLVERLFDSLMEEIDIFLTSNDSIPSGIKNDDYDSKGDILFLEELLSNDSPSLAENKSFHFDVPSSSRPPAFLPTQPTLASNEEKSPHLLSHWGFNVFHLSFESPMMIYGRNIPVLISRILNTRARGFVLRSLDLHILSFILGIQYPNLID
uniref:Reverse transcriptase domain-containing protein n=1 Tax=Tanacetum cinerariifolium TaxID=118510 RepID=A0A6L2JNG6_TANCI|nr:hypothetical protein [Tanacetum cinerariifolium]